MSIVMATNLAETPLDLRSFRSLAPTPGRGFVPRPGFGIEAKPTPNFGLLTFIYGGETTLTYKTTQLLFLTTPDFKIAQVAGVFVEHMLRPQLDAGLADLDEEIVKRQGPGG